MPHALPPLPRFLQVFADVYETEYRKKFVFAGITYEHRLIDDMVAQVCEGGGGGLEGRSTGSLMTWWHRCVKGGGGVGQECVYGGLGGLKGRCVWGGGWKAGGGSLRMRRTALILSTQDCTRTEYGTTCTAPILSTAPPVLHPYPGAQEQWWLCVGVQEL